jgi:hypothetical protein
MVTERLGQNDIDLLADSIKIELDCHITHDTETVVQLAQKGALSLP